jgi:SAM-dependent methyltransferase
MADHWNQHAQQWQWIASPLRPTREDIAFAERAVNGWHRKNQSPVVNVLLLGVTPEIALMQWPASTQLVAVDHSQAMIDGVWPGDTPARAARCAEWVRLPLPDASQHIVIGDGCFNALLYPDQYRAAVDEARRVLLDNGIFVIRFFLRPGISERVDTVIGDLLHGRIGNFHVFKWRLAMALHGNLEEGVRLADIWDAWHSAVPDPESLAVKLDCPREILRTIDNYRDVETRYTFPTLAEARAAFAFAFIEAESFSPRYELGDRCPTLVFRPR